LRQASFQDEYASYQDSDPSLQTPSFAEKVAFRTLPQVSTVDSTPLLPPRTKKRRIGKAPFLGALILVLLLGGYAYGKQALVARDTVIGESERGFDALNEAARLLKEKNYEQALVSFQSARRSFEGADQSLDFLGGPLLGLTRPIPFLSKLSSGRHAVLAGKYFALAGEPLATLTGIITESKGSYQQGEKRSILETFLEAKVPLSQASAFLKQASSEIGKVNIRDIPADKQEKFLEVKMNLPVIVALLSGLEKNETLIEELLGGNGPRTYLFLLQNNHELRATGGFIGTYALVDIHQGVIRRFFVDGIYNPDGQLKENIVPPKPIQKISAGWSLHDSNWFPDFPTSAEKAIFFYEKTGGPTVDGVITLTPTTLQKLLTVIGPINLPEYGLTVDATNFIPVLQEEVEVNYDRTLNQPKKVLADLTRVLIEKVFALQDKKALGLIAEALVEALNEKHMLIYARHQETQKLIDEVGWSGRVMDTPKDYLSVIHSNINGYKTDGVIDESIEHEAKIEEDGSIIDTVTIKRKHNGGDTLYDWWNQVNADYVRVYVPKGSELLSSTGTTWEFPKEPLDYDALGFKRDAQVEEEEKNMIIDQKTGVRISEDAGKTVFGAWAYVSPKETVTLTFRYRLPFRIDHEALKRGEPQSYGVLVQKQSGSPGSTLTLSLSYPESLQAIWQTAPNLVPYGRQWRRETDLKKDVFQGVVFGQ